MASCPSEVAQALGVIRVDESEAVFLCPHGIGFVKTFFFALAELCDAEGYQQTWIPFTEGSYAAALRKAEAG